MAKHIYTHINPSNRKHLAKACCIFENGGVVAYPTDVNWAIGCDASNSKALKKILSLKPGHPKTQPFSLLCSSLSMVSQVAFLDHSAYRMLKKALPGPYTILLKPQKNLARQINDKRRTVGVRVPNCPLLLDLINYYKKPLATSSLVFEENQLHFGYEVDENYGYGIDLILDLGQELIPYETSIVDLTEGLPKIMRQGRGSTDFFK